MTRLDRLWRVECAADSLLNAAAIAREERTDGDRRLTDAELAHLMELLQRIASAVSDVQWGERSL